MGWGVPIYVAETDRQAREEFEPHLWYFVAQPAQEHHAWRRRATRRRSSALAILKNRGMFLSEQKTWDDIEKGVFAIVGSPETVRQKLESVSQGTGRRRRADRLSDRHAAARAGAQEHGTAGPRGAAACSRLCKKLKYGARVLLSRSGGQAETIDVTGRPTVLHARRRRDRPSSTCTAPSASRSCGCRSTRPGRSSFSVLRADSPRLRQERRLRPDRHHRGHGLPLRRAVRRPGPATR